VRVVVVAECWLCCRAAAAAAAVAAIAAPPTIAAAAGSALAAGVAPGGLDALITWHTQPGGEETCTRLVSL